MFNIDSLLDREVFVALQDMEPLLPTGIDQKENIFILKGYEQKRGIWVEIRGIKDSPVRADGLDRENCRAIVFIPWQYIATMMYLPEHERLEIETPGARKIGFRQDQ